MDGPDFLARSDALLAAGHTDHAIALVRDVANADNVDALYRLAVWHLAGNPVPRDLPAALGLLRRAVAIGHVDAALIEIALTANGTAALPDWPKAVDLLRIAGAQDPVAADQLALLDRMDLDVKGDPLTIPPGRRLSTTPDVQLFPALLTPDECRHIAMVGSTMLEPALVADPATGQMIRHPVRTSHGAVIGPAREDLVIHAINRRLAVTSRTTYQQGEPLVVLHYAPGQEYRPHIDALPGVTNQRTRTMLVYLNQAYRGGETRFVRSRLSVTGRTGDVLMFTNTDTVGKPDPLSLHAGLPVTEGRKWLATRWIRARPHDPWSSTNG